MALTVEHAYGRAIFMVAGSSLEVSPLACSLRIEVFVLAATLGGGFKTDMVFKVFFAHNGAATFAYEDHEAT